MGVRIEWFGSPRWTADKHCDATSQTTKLRKAQTNMPPVQKKPGHYRNQRRQLKRKKDQARNKTSSANNNNNNKSGQTNSNYNNKISNNTNANNTNIQKDRRPGPVYPPSETCCKTNHSTEKRYFGANATNKPPPRNRRADGQNQAQQRNAQNNADGNVQAAAQTLNKKRHVITPALHVTERRQLENQNFHQFPRMSGSKPWRQVYTDQSNLDNTNSDYTTHYTQETSKTTVASQMSPPKGTQPRNYLVATEYPPAHQTGNESATFLNCSKNRLPDI